MTPTSGRRGRTDSTEGSPRRRADAERNMAAIVEAAQLCFRANPDVTMADIARTTGVGRVTLYAHFPSREVLLKAVVVRAIAEADVALADAIGSDDPADQAMARLIRSSWRTLDRFGSLSAAATRHLDPDWLRDRHDKPMRRAELLITRGQEEGVFRGDLPRHWLVTAVYSLLHAAAVEVDAGRLETADAGRVLEATVLSALTHTPGHAEVPPYRPEAPELGPDRPSPADHPPEPIA
ncbi:TetR/AcrR family transcriptional regulator [Streptosporangium sp. CA-135522]|uniref:TetR/AcrR family transcriptional regulator n=1 Tax=Streptosporangium sp. CA-135522 TaxID=3240072 RepID=UPI003D9086FF